MSEAGKIIGVRDCSTLVIIFLEGGDGRILPLPIDNNRFRHLLESESCSSAELVGRSLSSEQMAALQR